MTPIPENQDSEENVGQSQRHIAADATKGVASGLATAGWERATLEKLAFAALQEQKAQPPLDACSPAAAWLLLIVAVFVALIWMLMRRGAPATDKSMPHTAVVEIRGEIAAEPTPAPNSSWPPCGPRLKTRAPRPWCC